MKIYFSIILLLWSMLNYAQTSTSTKEVEQQEWKKRINEAVVFDESREVLEVDSLELIAIARECEALEFDKCYMDAYRYLGDSYLRNSELEKAISYYQKALRKTQNDAAFWQSHFYLNQRIGNCYIKLGRPEEGEKIHQQQLKLIEQKLSNEPSNSNDLLPLKNQVFINLGNALLPQGRIEEAISFYTDAHQSIKKDFYEEESAYESDKQVIAFNLGAAYLFQGNGKAAKPYVEEHLDYILKEDKDYKFIAQSYGNLAYCEYLLQNFDAAYENYAKSLNLSEQYQYPDVTYVTYKDLSDTYLADGKPKEAIQYLAQHHQLKDSLQGVEVQKNIDALKIEYETELKEQEIVRLEQDNQIERQQKLLYASGMGVFLLLGAIGVLYFYNVNKRRKQAAELQQLQLAKAQQELNYKEKELTYKKQDVTRLALEIRNKQELTEQLLTQINTLEKSVQSDTKRELRKLGHHVRDYLQSNDEQQLLKKNLEEINHAFYGKLSENYPQLNQTDRELCSYIRLGLSNKEIAALRNLSAEGVRSRRFRLRKKLNLDSKEDVEVFLQGF